MDTRNMGFGLAAIVIVAIAAMAVMSPQPSRYIFSFDDRVAAFASQQEFLDYIEESGAGNWYYGGFGATSGKGQLTIAMDTSEGAPAPTAPTNGAAAPEPERVSETNVQVAGIDEPDIVKTDGNMIYFSPSSYWYWGGGIVREAVAVDMAEPDIAPVPPGYQLPSAKVIDAFPVEDLELIATIDRTGEMLLSGDSLVIFSGDAIYGYDVSDPASPAEEWKMDLEGTFSGARLHQGKIYLVVMNWVDRYSPCPIVPLSMGGVRLEIACTKVYHPVAPAEASVAYSAMVFDPATGEVEGSVSFLGSYSSVLYMSENGVYLTYPYSGDIIALFLDMMKENTDLFPQSVIDRLDKLQGYDISLQAKMTEFGSILEQWLNSLSRDERLRVENELSDRMESYTDEHKREITRTGIVRIGLGMEVEETGSVPGTLLNQFSVDEHQGYLRVAVTVGETWSGSSANDVYVLDGGLDVAGYVMDMGLTEKIYSVRFIGDKGYVVTFRQIDPFYVLDLSDPRNPQLKGELKIPGYSSYLHPITDDRILGIGKEGSNVKISLFDVSDPANPTEADKYELSEYWTDILNTHHAFLLDSKHGVFFMPGSQGGYVFSYGGDDLKLERAVSGISARRAVYMDDYMYIIGDDSIVVLDENTWEEANELEL
jgi:inhibitor of cysteine peptidase